MIHFYRPLSEIKAITFDLDDTLYDNQPVMAQTEHQVMLFLHQHYPELSHMSVVDLKNVRTKLRESEPEIYHDVSQWRWRSIEWLLLHYGYSSIEAQKGATDAMAQFNHWRSQVDVPPATHLTLRALKQRFKLAAITNGNADPGRFGLASYFEFVLKAGPDGKAKPFNDLFYQAASRLNLPCEQILHVGDDLQADVMGAINAGMQACWINDKQKNVITEHDARVLPHIEISLLDSLQALL